MIANIDITPVAVALISLASAVLTGFAIPWINAKAGEARSRTLMTLARIGVQAAEQIYVGQEKAGDRKRTYVEGFLNQHGFSVDAREVESAIEAAVYEMHKNVGVTNNV